MPTSCRDSLEPGRIGPIPPSPEERPKRNNEPVLARTVLLALAFMLPETQALADHDVSCVYDDATNTATLSSPRPAYVLIRSADPPDPSLGFHEVQGDTLGPWHVCGEATGVTTDRIVIDSTGELGMTACIDERETHLGSGEEKEPTFCCDEIEISFDGARFCWLGGNPAGHYMWLGSLGIDVRGDGDRDVELSSAVEEVWFLGGPGEDILMASGPVGPFPSDVGGPSALRFRADGGDGNDHLAGGLGPATLAGGRGDDSLRSMGPASMTGGKGDEYIFGGSGDDRIAAGAGKDYVDGRGGRDRISGGAGDDRLKGGPARDRVDGGGGHDECDGQVERRCEAPFQKASKANRAWPGLSK